MSGPGRAAVPGTTAIVATAMVAFAGIGINEATLGVAFPRIRDTFDVPLGMLGFLLVPSTAGYLLVAARQSRGSRPLPPAPTLVAGATAALLGAFVYATSPVFGLMLVGSVLIGTSAGLVDTTLNNVASVHLEPRVLSFMHGGFGVGAMAGPFAATAVLQAGWSWRWVYAAVVVFQAVLGARWFGLRLRLAALTSSGRRAPSAPEVEVPAFEVPAFEVAAFEGDVGVAREVVEAEPHVIAPPARPRLVLSLNIALFFLYTGAEASTGLLLPTLLAERGLSEGAAGLLTTGFWAALTAGRFANGLLGRRLTPSQALAGASVGCLVGASMVAVGGGGVAGVGAILLGLSFAPIFPSLVAMTPARVGTERAHVAIAYQLGAASAGVAAIPALIGVIAGRGGAEAIGGCLLAATVALVATHVAAGRLSGDLLHPRAA